MSTIYNTTITDKPLYEIKILDEVRFKKLNVEEQFIFEIIRNSMLEIMPKNEKDNFHDEECVRYAENYAFINMKIFTVSIVKIIDAKIKKLEDKVNLLSKPK